MKLKKKKIAGKTLKKKDEKHEKKEPWVNLKKPNKDKVDKDKNKKKRPFLLSSFMPSQKVSWYFETYSSGFPSNDAISEILSFPYFSDALMRMLKSDLSQVLNPFSNKLILRLFLVLGQWLAISVLIVVIFLYISSRRKSRLGSKWYRRLLLRLALIYSFLALLSSW